MNPVPSLPLPPRRRSKNHRKNQGGICGAQHAGNLRDEIEMLRDLIQRAYQELTVEPLPLLDMLGGMVKVGVTCTRLAALMKVEGDLVGEDEDRVLAALTKAFDEALAERARE